ncbi:MAG: Hsp20/alpha crystallin family protein [Deltaproteobacteria bacterium]|nr:Hsp20/alpha crystallin family protein [Deltaproteobacteria bacterium]
MANIAIRKDGGEQVQQAGHVSEWDPFRMMRNMLRWDPFREMTQLVPEERMSSFMPAFEVKETKDAYVLRADIPGVKEADLEVTLTGNRLTIGGKRDAEKQEKHDTWYVYERSYGSFTRSFTLPPGIDANAISASLDKGVLTVNIGKKPEVQAKKIAISGEKGKS